MELIAVIVLAIVSLIQMSGNMKKLLILLALSAMFTSSADCAEATSGKDEKVWICTGKSSACYHCNKSCKGLSNCKATKKRLLLKMLKEWDEDHVKCVIDV